ncbi:eukaryotic translation initiation factor 2C 2 [Ceratobasidium sp. AG-Ba]|nr:eukaryotic translation initiation factor 2C 2 [Ceratobasidium sp. AG-Ba]
MTVRDLRCPFVRILKRQSYAVVIELDGKPTDFAPPRNREIIDELQAQEAAIFRPRGVYDGRKNLFSINQFSFHPAAEAIKLKAAGLIHMSTLNALMQGRVGIDQADATQIAVTALNYVIRMAPVTNSNYPLKGASFFMDIPQVSKNLAKGLRLYRGFFQSVRPAVDRMLVNIDVATGVVFQPLTVLDFALAFLNLRDARQTSELSENQLISLTRILKGIQVVPTGGRPSKNGKPHKPKTIKNVDKRSAASYMFDRNGTQMSVQQHIQEQHGIRLQYPNAPCVIVNRDAAYPIEFLKILPHQLLKRPVPPELTSEVLNFSTQKPDDRIRQITQGFQQLQYAQSDYLSGANVVVDNQPLGVPARILAPPGIEFGGNQTMHVKDGTWNMLRKQMYKPRKVACWGIVVFDHRFSAQHAQQLAKRLVQVMEERGIKVLDHEPVIENATSRTHDVPGVLDGVARRALQQAQVLADQRRITDKLSPNLIVCVLPFPATEIRTAIKRWGDCQVGVPTQCVVGKKYSDQLQKNRDDQYVNNLVLKIHAKLGGTNFVPSSFKWDCPTMVMGGDVSHPPPGSQGHPSISAVVGSMDFQSCQYSARSNVQASREERIIDIGSMTTSLIREFATANKNTPPKHILFFRDGLSEGQFGTFGQQEINEMKKAFAALNINPALTFVCVAKRHHVRFFADRQQQDRSGNCQPGTVVDSHITHPAIWDFYLQSHPGLKGTSAPSHYTVLLDEKQYSADRLQNIAHSMCHIYARSTRSVSIPAPVYYADIITARGRFHFSPDVHFSDDGDANYTDQHYRQAWIPLHERQRSRMYYM